MGYTSDVVLAAALANKEWCDGVMAVYRMDPKVQEHNCAASWNRRTMSDGVSVLWYSGENVKWYETYEDVQAMEHMKVVLQEFFDNRGMPFSWFKVRFGEDVSDIEEVYESEGDDDTRGHLSDVLFETIHIKREITVDLIPDEKGAPP